MAALRLDAADRQQRLTSHSDEIAAEREREQRCFGEAEFPRSVKHHPIIEPVLRKLSEHAGKANFEGQRNVIREHERSRAGAALAAIDGDEVDASIADGHQPSQLAPE